MLQVLEGDGEDLKVIRDVLDEEPLLSETMLRLAAFIRQRYFCTFYDAAKAMLPAGLWFQGREVFSVAIPRRIIRKLQRESPLRLK